ncbi:TPR repeat protein [Candidatus Sulfotelmatobacter kueseliae]|uniref:TPR repeat protein n=1 Tax=Candidatus Sulfotelmatobacter kueseliae TaxID=2042962 RepID=A0A2U3KX14_9BACT|nr:TPR repeat protein [Candidatus Sulfotelmatobacter kueseliae]
MQVPMNFRLHAILPPAAMLLRRFPMPSFFRIGLPVIALVWFNTLLPGQVPAPGNASSAERGLALAQKGRCKEALPILKKSTPLLQDKQLRYGTLMATARCAMSLERTETAVGTLLELNRDFPHDPDVLYMTTHFYSELASRASQELATMAPSSPQAEQLEAEAFESHGDWDRALAEYQKILEQDPQRHGIHYQLGRVLLSKTPPDGENAKKEFEEELRVNPNSASAEFMLGETARQAGQWDEAIVRFSKAADLDAGFDEAYLALGMSLNSAGKFPDAIRPLETYVKRQPGDPAGHYQLATSYARTGHKQEAQREMQLQRETAARVPREAPQP